MTVTRDVHIEQYGDPGNAHQPLVQPLAANTTVYRGTLAITDGTTGYLKNPDTAVGSTDIVWGLIEGNAPGSGVADITAGVVNSSSVSGVNLVQIRTGTFFLACDTTLTQANIGAKLYVKDAITVSLTSTSRPLAGVLMAIDTSRTQAPGPYAVDIGTGIVAPTGGP